jgi:signal transduction histidine kinase
MNLRKKLTMHFLSHFIVMLVIIILLIITALVTLSFIISRSEMKSDFMRTSDDYLEHAIGINGQEVTMNQDVKDSVRKNDGWLQVVEQGGRVIGKFNTPEDLPETYDFIDILSLKDRHYRTKYWEINKGKNSTFTVIYGEKVRSHEIADKVSSMKDFPVITKEVQNYLNENNAWIQVYDPKGKITEFYGVPENLHYSFNKLINSLEEPWDSKYDISLYTPDDSRSLYIIGTDNPFYTPKAVTEGIINQSFIKGFLIVSSILVALIIVLGLWYGKKFGVPLLHTLNWVNDLSEGKHASPFNKKGKSPLLNKAGKLSKRYIFFKEVVDSLETLTLTLKKNEQLQQKVDKTREEWITGLSHDLKTPISSIYGYSTLLASDSYIWSQTEINDFGRIIQEKSHYMSELIEDLNLTYRLKNDALPLHKEKVDIIPFLQKWMIQHQSSDKPILLETAHKSLYLEIDQKWFSRIMNNLVVNAIKYNPAGTTIKVNLLQSDTATIISVKDNGTGIDPETIQNLFNRYYRGGNTKDSDNGSGLGMAIAHQLVAAHGGRVEVASELNTGTTIRLIFPCAGKNTT